MHWPSAHDGCGRGCGHTDRLSATTFLHCSIGFFVEESVAYKWCCLSSLFASFVSTRRFSTSPVNTNDFFLTLQHCTAPFTAPPCFFPKYLIEFGSELLKSLFPLFLNSCAAFKDKCNLSSSPTFKENALRHVPFHLAGQQLLSGSVNLLA